ncbi:MAG TPA: hypothetical protein VMQ17_11565 [Candidatus Sulfotelmatobacter sp.]|nr:hypothetical protein [Candidatus Sulfotelmatobacter sp.]
MMFRNAAIVVVVLAVTTALAQSAPPAPTVPGGTDVISQGRGPVGRRISSLGAKRPTSAQTPSAPRQHFEDLESTVNQMHAMLKQMQSRAAKSRTKDSFAIANLGMWELMVGHLDKEVQALRAAIAAREDMEARRAALYKQADVKAEAEAQAGRAGQAAKSGVEPPPSLSGAHGAVQSPAGQNASGQAPAAQTPSSTATPASPATSAPSPN